MQESHLLGLSPVVTGQTRTYPALCRELSRVWIFSEAIATTADRLLSDGYMAHHPDGDGPQQRQSVAAHLVTLNSVLRIGQPIGKASAITRAPVDVGLMLDGYPKLRPPVVLELHDCRRR